MNDAKNIRKGSKLGVNLLRRLAEEGKRIFTVNEARTLAQECGLSESSIPVVLHHLKQDEWVVALRKGVYALGPALIGGTPLREYEIAMYLVSPSAISHWSAFHFHELTDQIPNTVYVLTPSPTVPRIQKFDSFSYRFIRVKPSKYFGVEKIWMGDAKVSITDLERTLLDGLMMPKHCGGFGEVLYAFQLASERLDIEKIVSYSLRLDVTTSKRLGWILSTMGVKSERLKPLKEIKIKGYRKLDATGPSKGSCDSAWAIQVNYETS